MADGYLWKSRLPDDERYGVIRVIDLEWVKGIAAEIESQENWFVGWLEGLRSLNLPG